MSDTWREKIQALRKLPKANARGTLLKTSARHLLHTYSLEELSQFYRLEDNNSNTHFVEVGKLQLCKRSPSKQVVPITSPPKPPSLPTVLPECLDTFSDFYNPRVSADERFEKYLREMKRREYVSIRKAAEVKVASRGDELGASEVTSVNKWRVLPRIDKPTSSTTPRDSDARESM